MDRNRWVLACVAAEAVGMTAAASAARLADALRGEGGGPLAVLAVVVAGGLVEGAALGGLQGAVLRPLVGRVAARRWAVVTFVVAGVGWAAASAPSAYAAEDTSGTAPPLWLVLAGAAALGATMGLLLGLGQAAALRAEVARPWRWVRVSALAWTPTMVVIFTGATLPAADWPAIVVVPLGTVTGLVAGAVLGLLSAPGADAVAQAPFLRAAGAGRPRGRAALVRTGGSGLGFGRAARSSGPSDRTLSDDGAPRPRESAGGVRGGIEVPAEPVGVPRGRRPTRS